MWGLWKEYKLSEHKFKYKNIISEQAALRKLASLSEGSEKTAIDILNESIANGWEGFFELKNNGNGKGNSTKQQSTASREEAIQRNFERADRWFGNK